PDWRTARGHQVDIGIEDGFVLGRGHFGERPAAGAGDQRAAKETFAAVDAGAVGRSDKDVIDVGGGDGQVRGHAFAGSVEQR
nr:hypothetical protein [Tanacetum cinerariifolium]